MAAERWTPEMLDSLAASVAGLQISVAGLQASVAGLQVATSSCKYQHQICEEGKPYFWKLWCKIGKHFTGFDATLKPRLTGSIGYLSKSSRSFKNFDSRLLPPMSGAIACWITCWIH